jgi:hypothetical protein
VSLWKVVVPEAARNWVLNPSAEAAGNFAALGAATVTADTTYSFRGRRSFKVVTTAGVGDDGTRLTLKTLENTAYYAHWWMYGSLPATFVCALSGSGTYRTPTLLETEGSWYHYGYPHAAGDANTSAYLDVRQTTAAAKTFYIDCAQVEQADHWTTYVDGDQPGCKWEGGRHASASTRDANSREGGRVRDFVTDYSAYVEQQSGLGSPTKEHLTEPRALVDGGVYQGTRAAERVVNLIIGIGGTPGTTLADYYSKRKAFMGAIGRFKGYPKQPGLFRYTGPGKTAQFRAIVEGGDEGMPLEGFYERFPLRLLSVDDVYFEELAEESATLNNSTTLAVEQMVAYRPSQPWSATTGYWDALGAPELQDHDNADVHVQRVYCWAKDKLGNLYMGGNFFNLNGVANADGIAKRDKNGVWSALGTGVNNGELIAVRTIAIDAANNVYAGGTFTQMGGVANTTYIAMWNGATWVAMGTGADEAVYGLAIDTSGVVYAVGFFTQMGGVAATGYAAKWSGGAWSAMGTGGGNAFLLCVTVGADGAVYVGGRSENIGGVAAADYIAKWSSSAWSSVGVFNSDVQALAVGPDGRIYATGDFTTIDSVSISRVAVYNGAKWYPLGSGVNGEGWVLAVTNGGLVYIGGGFSTAGGVSTADRIAMWNGTSWSALPIDLPGSATVYGLLADGDDVYFGFDTEGSATISGVDSATGSVTSSGTAPCSPVITIACTVATATLQEVRNATTGQVIRFNRAMQIGETITIDTRSGMESVRSDFPPPNGSQVAMLQPSDLGNFCLMPGANYISVYAPGTGATVTVSMVWRIKHDEAAGVAT